MTLLDGSQAYAGPEAVRAAEDVRRPGEGGGAESFDVLLGPRTDENLLAEESQRGGLRKVGARSAWGEDVVAWACFAGLSLASFLFSRDAASQEGRQGGASRLLIRRGLVLMVLLVTNS